MIRAGVSSSSALSAGSRWLGLALGGIATGVALTFVGSLFGEIGPFLVLGLPALALLAVVSYTRPLIAVALVVLVFPIGNVSLPTGPVSLQAAEVMVVAVAVVVALHRLARGQTLLPWTPHLWWMIALLGWSLVALPSAADGVLAIKQVAQLAGGLLFGTCVIAACRDMADVRRLMIIFAVVAVAISVVALVTNDQMQASFGGTAVTGRAEGTFDQPNQLGAFSALAVLTTIGLALSARSRKERVVMIVLLAIVMGAMLLSLSRGAWIGSAAAVVFLALVLKGSRRLILGTAIPIFVVAALAGALASSTPQVQIVTQRIEAFTILSPYDNRSAIWSEAFREIRADPITGQGPGSFPVASARASSEATTASADHAHNLWLTWAAEAGVPAALLLTGFMLSLAAAALRTMQATTSASDRALVGGLAAALITVAGQGTIDYTLRNMVVFFSVWTLIGALIASWRILGAAAPQPSGATD